MNAPTPTSHLLPELHLRNVPDSLIEGLKARFGSNCSTAMAVRTQHGRDESSFDAPPPRPWCLPKARRTWPTR